MSIQVKESALTEIPHKVLLLGAGAIIMALQVGAQYTFPVLALPMSAELGWSRGATAGAVSLRFLLGAAAQLLLGSLVDRFGHRRIGVLGSGLMAVGLACSAGISELWHLLRCGAWHQPDHALSHLLRGQDLNLHQSQLNRQRRGALNIRFHLFPDERVAVFAERDTPPEG
jgi:hypothetical protein